MTVAPVKNDMLTAYESLSKASAYIVGFMYQHRVYFTTMQTISESLLSVEQASRNQGSSLRLRIRKSDKVALMSTNPICLGDEDILTATSYNKGENFEKAVTEYYGQAWKKDTDPFYIKGDINIDGIEVQIKFEGATLTNTKQLEKLLS